MVEYKGGACQLCGYARSLRALDFHHVDPTTKQFSIAGSHNRSWDSLRAELDKCLLVCSNCHGELEGGFRRLPSNPRSQVGTGAGLRRRRASSPHASGVGETLVVCQTCGRRFVYDRKKGHTKRRCNSCGSNRATAAKREQLKRWMVRNAGGSCCLCGYRACLHVLTFHHVDPTRKRFHIAGSHNRSLEALRAELAKCVLVCANCHDELEAGDIELPQKFAAGVDVQPRIRRKSLVDGPGALKTATRRAIHANRCYVKPGQIWEIATPPLPLGVSRCRGKLPTGG